jgi:hypothetical protein
VLDAAVLMVNLHNQVLTFLVDEETNKLRTHVVAAL